MVRQESIKALNEYIDKTLKRHKVTINGVEIDKKYQYIIKDEHKAKLFNLVLCDNVEYAARLVSEDLASDKNNLYNFYLRKFTEEAEKLGIEPNSPVGIDIIVF